MSKNTKFGKSFDVNELIKLAQIGALNADQHKGAILGALNELKKLHADVAAVNEENKRLQSLLNEHMGNAYRADKESGE